MLRLTILRIGLLVTIAPILTPQVMAANVTPIRRSIADLRAQAIFKSGEQPAQAQRQPELRPNFGWQNSTQLRSTEREQERFREEQRQFNYFYPNRQLQTERANPTQSKDTRLNTSRSYQFNDNSKYRIRQKPIGRQSNK